MVPGTPIPRGLLFQLVWAGLRGSRRDLRRDARAFTAGLVPPPRLLGEECIPRRGPCLVLMNHYSRPGFDVWRLALAVSSALSMPHTWVATSGWTSPGRWFEPLKLAASGYLFRRLAQVYGLLLMPPMPPRPGDAGGRAAAVRKALAYVDDHTEAVMCLAPEGRDLNGGKLGWPPAGAGRFISLLAGRGLSLLPVGGWEVDGGLIIRFGPPYRLEERLPAVSPDGQEKAARDRAAAEVVMRSIARLLPEPLRGEFT